MENVIFTIDLGWKASYLPYIGDGRRHIYHTLGICHRYPTHHRIESYISMRRNYLEWNIYYCRIYVSQMTTDMFLLSKQSSPRLWHHPIRLITTFVREWTTRQPNMEQEMLTPQELLSWTPGVDGVRVAQFIVFYNV